MNTIIMCVFFARWSVGLYAAYKYAQPQTAIVTGQALLSDIVQAKRLVLIVVRHGSIVSLSEKCSISASMT